MCTHSRWGVKVRAQIGFVELVVWYRYRWNVLHTRETCEILLKLSLGPSWDQPQCSLSSDGRVHQFVDFMDKGTWLWVSPFQEDKRLV